MVWIVRCSCEPAGFTFTVHSMRTFTFIRRQRARTFSSRQREYPFRRYTPKPSISEQGALGCGSQQVPLTRTFIPLFYPENEIPGRTRSCTGIHVGVIQFIRNPGFYDLRLVVPHQYKGLATFEFPGRVRERRFLIHRECSLSIPQTFFVHLSIAPTPGVEGGSLNDLWVSCTSLYM